MISQKSEVINQFFMKELVELIEKFNKLEEQMVNRIEKLWTCIKDKKTKQRLMGSLDQIVKLAECIGEEVDEDLIMFYFGVQDNICDISMEEAKELWEELSTNGHVMIENEDTIIYSDERNLREYVEDRIDDILRTPYEVDRLFDKDTLIEYLTEEIFMDEVAREMMNNVYDYEKILDLHAEHIFEASNGERYQYGVLG